METSTNKMNLEQIQLQASKFQQEFNGEKFDWKEETKKIWKAKELVTKWQDIMLTTFKEPQIHTERVDWNGDLTGKWEWNYIRSGDIIASLDPKIRFEEACILQMQVITETEKTKNVCYRAELRINENHCLQALLPQTKTFVDPIYKLIEINISIPKEQLIAESIRVMNEKITQNLAYREQLERESQQVKPKKHWWDRSDDD
jgi:hypothetical protein